MALVKMIAKDELPFSFVEAEGFLKFMQTCCPRFDVSSRRTITRDILELYQYEKGLLKSVLGASKQRVCITTDIWSSIQMSNYMVITAHFIDAEWVLHKRILSFTPIANHKGDGIGKLIETCLIDWGIERLFTITVDNASANKVAIIYVKKKLANWSVNSMVLNGLYMHVRCSAYIINLIVQDGLAEVNHSIASIRNAVKSVRSSPARLQKFKTCVDREKISYEGLMVLDVPTRWNSTYLMLHKAVVFEKAFDRMKEDDGHYVNWFVEDEGEKKMEGPPSNDDWGNARSIYESRKVEELKSNIKELLMKLCNSYIGGSDVRNSGGFCFGDIHNGSSGGGGGGASSSIMYLILSQIAKDVLAIPVSTVASESAFSTRGCVLDPCRSSLTHKTVESLICTQNWLRSTLLGKQIIQPTQEETEFYKVIEAEFGRPIVAQQEQAAEE
ncbi:BED-type domain-containing protein [Citrus sinensis]|uniref:BED-type domain-containing protein n=1 Tax=Citrus sinensis TaxID=2711 RepID=A0ACB8L2B5_CITSI|nr:BED-type domain-containing protein [Citrus sinensis]